MMPDIIQNIDQDNYLANVGIKHTITINSQSYIKTTLSYSAISMKFGVFESTITGADTSGSILNYDTRIRNSTYKAAITYNNKLNAKNKIQIGTVYSLINENNNQSQLEADKINQYTLIAYTGIINTLQNFVSWKHNFNDEISLDAGFHNMNVFSNHKSTIEPRFALNWKPDNISTLYIGYGKHSTMENIHNYYTRVEQADGSIIEPNKNLGLLKADHYVIGYEKRLNENLRAKAEIYYQNLYNLPVENNIESTYATINEGSDYMFVPLVNKGKGRNYGIEATLERFFNNHYYFLINGSLFDSKYKTLEGVWRNTKYNSNYLVNILYGKEFNKLGRKENKTLSLNAKAFFSGGQRYIPLLRDENSNLAVDPANRLFWDYSKTYERTLDDFFYLSLSLSYKINKPGVTHEIFLDLNNLTNSQGKLSEYYDVNKPDKIGYILQGSFLPNLMYRVIF